MNSETERTSGGMPQNGPSNTHRIRRKTFWIAFTSAAASLLIACLWMRTWDDDAEPDLRTSPPVLASQAREDEEIIEELVEEVEIQAEADMITEEEQGEESQSESYEGGDFNFEGQGMGGGRGGRFGGARSRAHKVQRLARRVERERIGPDRPNTEDYDHLPENDFIPVGDAPLSTFSIDVDTASYANLRRFLEHGQKPPKGAIRIEELVNYFHYEDPAPTGELPFTATLEVAQCPWKLEHRLVRIGLKGREIPTEQRPASNLVFLLDVSGSMQPDNKLPLLKRAMRLLVDSLGENDRVAIVVYAGASGLALPSTSCAEKETIRRALDELSAGGSTNGAAGIQLAYQTAVSNFISGGLNRVILCTDGDFNVGVSNRSSLVELIQEKARSGVFLSVLGFGMGNIKDGNLEALADKGNGNYAYIDSLAEARKVLVREMGATLIAIAKDVKIQIEFNPTRVAAYRLIGYENRLLAARDFNDDTKDAGEIGAGTSVTALYELVPAGAPIPTLNAGTDPLRYQGAARLSDAATSSELLNFKLRYKQPDEDVSRLIEASIEDRSTSFDRASTDLRFAAAVAAFGMILRESQYRGGATLETVDELARDALGADPHGDRAGFLRLLSQARSSS